MNNVGISLGNICYSAMYGVAQNFRKNKLNGYLTCPFDLMISNYDGIVDCINTDFAYFCNINYIELTSNGIMHKKYKFIFNHESPDHADLYLREKWPEGKHHFTKDNFKNFVIRYKDRIKTFRNYLNDPNNNIIFLIQFVYDKCPDDDFSKLRNALSAKYPNLKYTIKLIPSHFK